MSRSIVFFTGTRAEYGLLRSLILQLQKTPDVDLSILVSGTHLSTTHGNTIMEIEQDNLPIAATVDISLDENKHLPAPVSICKSMGFAIDKLSETLYNLQPDLLVILGDRYEALCCASAATILTIPIAHLHGGEQTLGAIDEAFRHSITKMSHIHFASCEGHKQRIIQMGEQPERVWNTGALGVENALNMELLSEAKIREHLGINSSQPYFLCTFHPVTLEPGQEEHQWQELQKALDAFPDYAVVITGANADPGGNAVNSLLAKWAQDNPTRIHFFSSLGVLRYLSAAKYAACVVGNSSSGIVEIPSLKTPVVNIGNRQKGRICSNAVIHCQTKASAIELAMQQAISDEHRIIAQTTISPYAGVDVAKNMAQILTNIDLTNIQQKKFYDIPR